MIAGGGGAGPEDAGGEFDDMGGVPDGEADAERGNRMEAAENLPGRADKDNIDRETKAGGVDGVAAGQPEARPGRQVGPSDQPHQLPTECSRRLQPFGQHDAASFIRQAVAGCVQAPGAGGCTSPSGQTRKEPPSSSSS